MKLTHSLLTSLLGTALVLSACTGAAPTPTRPPVPSASGGPTDTPFPPAGTATATTAPVMAPTPTPVVLESIISNLTFESFTVPVGTKVVWINQDVAPHTTTAGTPGRIDGAWDSPTLNPGEQFSFTFSQAGTFPYWCRVHPQMTGTVTVR